jgi:hypothetical protein
MVGCTHVRAQVSGTVSYPSYRMHTQPSYIYFVSCKPYEKFAGPKTHIIILLYGAHLQRASLREVCSAGDAVRKTCKLCVRCPTLGASNSCSKRLLRSSSFFFCPSVYMTHLGSQLDGFSRNVVIRVFIIICRGN